MCSIFEIFLKTAECASTCKKITGVMHTWTNIPVCNEQLL